MQENSNSKTFVTISDDLILGLADKLINYVAEKRKEEFDYDMELKKEELILESELEKNKLKHDKDFKDSIIKALRDSHVIENLSKVILQKISPDPKFYASTTPSPSSPYVKSEKDIIVEMQLMFALHSRNLKLNLDTPTFELIKNIFKSNSEKEIQSNVDVFKSWLTIYDNGGGFEKDKRYLYTYFYEKLCNDEKYFILKYIVKDYEISK